MANQNAQHSYDAMRCQAEQHIPAPPGLAVLSGLQKGYGLMVPVVTGGEIHKRAGIANSGDSEMKETEGNRNGGGKGRG